MPKASRARRRKLQQNRQASREQPTTTASATGELRPRRQIQEMSPRMRVISLVIGDILCFLIFAALGTKTHEKGASPLLSAWVALPFLAAWFLVSPFTRAFKADVATRPLKMMLRTALSWLATWPVAMAFRWLMVDRVSPDPVSLSSFMSFATVALVANLVLLLIWRGPFALNNSLRKRGV